MPLFHVCDETTSWNMTETLLKHSEMVQLKHNIEVFSLCKLHKVFLVSKHKPDPEISV